jgi:hypothetical protein
MSKSRQKKFNVIDREYMDGDYENKKTVNDRRKEKRFDRALKTKNIDVLLDMEEYEEENAHLQFLK